MSDVKYDSTSINDGVNYIVRSVGHLQAPKRDVDLLTFTEHPGGKLIDTVYNIKIIPVVGTIIAASASEFEQKVDELKELFSRNEKNLDVDWRGGQRRYKCVDIDFKAPTDFFNLELVAFQADFAVIAGYGEDTSTTSDSLAAQTTTPVTRALTIGGSHEAYPSVTFTVNTETALTVIAFKTDATSDEIAVTPTGGFSAADILTINMLNNTVLYNAAAHDYTGIFPRFPVGSVTYTVTFTSTAHNVDIGLTYTKLWL